MATGITSQCLISLSLFEWNAHRLCDAAECVIITVFNYFRNLTRNIKFNLSQVAICGPQLYRWLQPANYVSQLQWK